MTKSNETKKSAPKSKSKPRVKKTAAVEPVQQSATMECNEFDTVLGEAHDLLGAAAESQALGRLKMANTYLLL